MIGPFRSEDPAIAPQNGVTPRQPLARVGAAKVLLETWVGNTHDMKLPRDANLRRDPHAQLW
jgi:hypothetical protein